MSSATIRSMAKLLTRRQTATIMSMGSRMLFHKDAGILRISDKHAEVEATLIVHGMEASELKTLLPLLQQHFSGSLVEARKLVHKHLALEDVDKHVGISCYVKVDFEGFEDSELKTNLHGWVQQPVFFPAIDEDKEPEEIGNAKRIKGMFIKLP